MGAVYGGSGARYERHRDNSGAPCNGRAVTAILYANVDWDADRDGGVLALWEEKGRPPRLIAPTGGRLVLFPSSLEHEVRPCSATRAAVTLWLLCAVSPRPPAA